MKGERKKRERGRIYLALSKTARPLPLPNIAVFIPTGGEKMGRLDEPGQVPSFDVSKDLGGFCGMGISWGKKGKKGREVYS